MKNNEKNENFTYIKCNLLGLKRTGKKLSCKNKIKELKFDATLKFNLQKSSILRSDDVKDKKKQKSRKTL